MKHMVSSIEQMHLNIKYHLAVTQKLNSSHLLSIKMSLSLFWYHYYDCRYKGILTPVDECYIPQSISQITTGVP